MSIELIQGEEGYRQLADVAFRASYAQLYDACPWSTAFQQLDFIQAWYGAYRREYRPVILCRFDAGRLSGVLPLAQSRDGSLTVAGANQAEYQCWLAPHDSNSEFLHEAAQALRRAFPGRSLQFRYLPADLPIADVKEHRLLRGHCELSVVPRPLFDTASWTETLRGRIKTKLNGLRRLGDFRFDRIKDQAAFAAVFDDIILQHNLRQGVAKGLPGGFLTDQNKRSFHLALFAHPQLMHVTTMKIGDELIASHIGFLSRGQLHLGILTTSVYQRYTRYSPGALHLLLLAQELAREGIDVLDLTPYGEFKERMATRSDSAHLLVLHPSRARLAYASTRNTGARLAKRTLARAGLTPARVRERINGARESARRLRRTLQRPARPLLLGAPVACVAGRGMAPASRNGIADLLLYKGRDRQQFLATAIARLEAGANVYSWSENGSLSACVWLSQQDEGTLQRSDEPRLPPRAALIVDVYCESGDPVELADYIAHIGALLSENALAEHIYILAPRDPLLLASLRTLGFAAKYSPVTIEPAPAHEYDSPARASAK